MSALFGKQGVRGLINVDITPERAMRLAMSYGTLLRKDAAVTASRDTHAASRVFKRAMIAGLNATGVSVRDLQAVPVAVNRFDLKSGNSAGGIHVRVSPDDPEEIEILFAEPPGVPIDVRTERKIENYFHREDFRRAFPDEMGAISYPPRLVESYLGSLVEAWDGDLIRRRALRLVVDYSYSPASLLLGAVLDKLGVEVMSLNVYADESRTFRIDERLPLEIEKVRRLVGAMGADLGVIFDPAAEHLFVVDETGEAVPDEVLLLLLLRHVCQQTGSGTVALPPFVTRHAEEVATACGVSVRRTRSDDAALLAEATAPGVIFAATLGGGYVFPDFVASMDATFTLGKVLELVAADALPLSELAAGMPRVHKAHRAVPCPWHVKGAVMRRMVEVLKHERVSLVDGIMVSIGEARWVQILPDADDPLFHLYAEGESPEDAAALVETYRHRLEAVIEERASAEE